MPQQSENIFSLKELGRLTGLTRRELEEHIRKGSLPAQKVGHEWVLTQEALLRFLDEKHIEPKWEIRPRLARNRALASWFAWLSYKRGVSPAAAFGYAALVHVALLVILGLVLGLSGGSEVSRFVSFSMETTTAPTEVENPVDQQHPGLVKQKAEVEPPAARTPPPESSKKEAKAKTARASKIATLHAELLRVAESYPPNKIEAEPVREQKLEKLEPVVFSENKQAEAIETERVDGRKGEGQKLARDSTSEPSAGLLTARQGPYRPGSGVTPPRLIHKVRPQYPKKAVDSGVKGTVELEIIVKADGSVGEIKVLGLRIEHLEFDLAAIEAVEQWKFVPGRFQGQPVDVIAVVAVNFNMED